MDRWIAQVAEAIIVGLWQGEKDIAILVDDVSERYTWETDRETGEPVTPLWVKNLANNLKPRVYPKGQRVMLVDSALTMERYHEGKIVLPSGSVGTIVDIEPNGGAIEYYVDFGTVTLLIHIDKLTPIF